MFPTEDYIHVVFVYVIIGLILCIPVLLPQWKKLVAWLNKRETKHKKLLEIFFCGLSIFIIVTALVLISYFNRNIITRLEFDTIEAEAEYFTYFAGFTFLLMPFAMALIGAVAFIHNQSELKFGDFFIILIAFTALALAGGFYHDVLWCGNATEWYTIVHEGGYDFDVWTVVVGVTNRDYQLLGASQGTLALILIIFCILLLWRYNSLSENRFIWQNKVKAIIIGIFIVLFFGFFLFIIDAAWEFDSNVTVHSLFLGMALIAFLFYELGKTLQPN